MIFEFCGETPSDLNKKSILLLKHTKCIFLFYPYTAYNEMLLHIVLIFPYEIKVWSLNGNIILQTSKTEKYFHLDINVNTK